MQYTDRQSRRLTVASAVEVEVMCLFLCFASPRTPIRVDVFTRAFGADVKILQCTIDTLPTGLRSWDSFSVEARNPDEMVTDAEPEVTAVRGGAWLMQLAGLRKSSGSTCRDAIATTATRQNL